MTQMNLPMKQKQTHIENRRVVAKGAGLGRGKFGEFGIGGCKVLYIEWITKSPV